MSTSALYHGYNAGFSETKKEQLEGDGWHTVIRGRPISTKVPDGWATSNTKGAHQLKDSEDSTVRNSTATDEDLGPESTPELLLGSVSPRSSRSRAYPKSVELNDNHHISDAPTSSTSKGAQHVDGLFSPASRDVSFVPTTPQATSVANHQINGSSGTSESPALKDQRDTKRVRKLSAAGIRELTASPESAILRPAGFAEQNANDTSIPASETPSGAIRRRTNVTTSSTDILSPDQGEWVVRPGLNSINEGEDRPLGDDEEISASVGGQNHRTSTVLDPSKGASTPVPLNSRYSTRTIERHEESGRSTKQKRQTPPSLHLDSAAQSALPSRTAQLRSGSPGPTASPMPPSIPLPPASLPTYLQLELSSARPSPLFIHRSATTDFPYESSKIKFERLVNFLLLPPQLELTLWFGALACLDAWLYTFTILPLRFFIALSVLGQWWGSTIVKEVRELSGFVILGLGRLWSRSGRRPVDRHQPVTPKATEPTSKLRSRGKPTSDKIPPPAHRRLASFTDQGAALPFSSASEQRRQKSLSSSSSSHRHRRSKSTPSALVADHKADLLKGLVVLFSCLVLMRFDASRMYHGIRGQAAIKLYVIYNVLEVCDRLFSALGQDVFECLFSKETLERTPDGRSKLLRPFGMFLLALTYNIIHSTALFYQVITLNVAVNSYSNALLTLLMSNQFVEIKSTVFKKFEKENLFQLTCADVVERFQLWLMLLIIAFRNIVEVGGLSLGGSGSAFWSNASTGVNGTNPSSTRAGNIVPKSFTIFPKWTGQVFGPFLLVLGSEMLVDWLKHAYITKFNNTKPAIYGRFLDVLAKDYYSNAFSDQNLTKRLGLPVIPLSCLFIRASLQTYHMFLATSAPLPLTSSATSLSVDTAVTSSPATTAALQHFDNVIRRALGRSTFGTGTDPILTGAKWSNVWKLLQWTGDDFIAFSTMAVFFLGAFLVLLAIKLVLGMLLLTFARSRYRGMKEREKGEITTAGRRIGGWGVVEVDDDKRRWIYHDDPDGARMSREREKKAMMSNRDKDEKDTDTLGGIRRYTMVAKRIW